MADEPTKEPLPQLFTDHVIGEAGVFADFLLNTFPEVESVAVAVSWRPPLSNLPSAVLKGRSGKISSPGEVTHMLEQVLRINEYLQQQLRIALEATDALMAEKANTLRNLERKIDIACRDLHARGTPHRRDADSVSVTERSAASVTDTTEDF